MPLSTGARLGPYEIVSAIGAGGMGEVYRARDTRLKREVALKILPESFAADPERLSRFQREAEVLASLNHPHIGAIYGLEDADGVRALVLELVEGETLADRIARGPTAIDEALPIARQIVEALEAAHEQGIIHRELKPANIKVTPVGVVKVLDFGLAKLTEASTGTAAGPAALSMAPTITSPAMMTGVGVLLGTAAYMSPEQAKGRPADKRSDIWAFGCVLYEMLTGKRPFDGEDVTDVMVAVLSKEPDWTTLPANVPAPVRTLLRRCLEKDRKRRLDSAAAARLEIDEASGGEIGTVSAALLPRTPLWRRIVIPVAAGVVVGGLITGIAVWRLVHSALPAPRLARFELPLPAFETLDIANNDHDLAISPDGTRVVFKAAAEGRSFLAVRAIDELTARPLQDLSQAVYGPFISPDGAWVGFSDEADRTLKRVSILGGPAVRICLTGASAITGASWGDDGTIVFGTATASGLWRVAAGGGTPTELTTLAPGQTNHAWPEMLPGGRAVLFTILNGATAENAQIAVLNLVTGEQKVLVTGGSYPRYSATGHIVYGIGGTLRAMSFDLKRLEVTGTAVPVVDGVITKDTASPVSLGAADFAMARDGSLVYLSAVGGAFDPQRTLVWVDRQGHETPISAPPRAYVYPRLSPDGTRVAAYVGDQERDIWVWNLGRTTLTRGTFDRAYDAFPVWTPDGRRLLFSSERAGVRNLFWQATDGTGAVERLTDGPSDQNATGLSPDGSRLVFTEFAPKTSEDVMQIELDRTHRVTPLVQSSFAERNGIVSPDGRWLAYEATDSGRSEIYVRPYPDVNSGHWQVSPGGGTRPLWARNGQELFYVSPAGALMRVGVERSPSWAATIPALVIKEGYATIGGNLGRTYDISSDGQRFLMIKNSGGSDQTAAVPKVIVVQHWQEELKRLVPTK
jgi:Tol biopolymer transport system component